MKVFAIGDLHLSGNPPTKPMDIFGPHWDNHWARIKEHWANNVTDDDIVFLVGDMSWALRLDEAACDLQEIASMPGKKYMIRGNHDYWWSSSNKMRNLMGDAITFLQGHGTAELIQTEEGPRIIAFGGTRAYLCPGDSQFSPETDQSIYERELMRTESALQEMDRAVETLLEHIRAINNRYTHHTSNKTAIVTLSSIQRVQRPFWLYGPYGAIQSRYLYLWSFTRSNFL